MQVLENTQTPKTECLIRILDVLMLYCMGHLAALIRYSSSIDDLAQIHQTTLYFCTALSPAIFSQFDLYQAWRGKTVSHQFILTASAIFAVLATGLILSFLIRGVDDLSRLWMAYWAGLTILAIIVIRPVVHSLIATINHADCVNKRVLIIGYGSVGKEIHQRAQLHHWAGYEVSAIHGANGANEPTANIASIPHLEDIPAAVKKHNIQEIWLALPLSEFNTLQKIRSLLSNVLVDIRWIPDTSALGILSHKTIQLFGMPVIDLNRPATDGIPGLAKELFDKVFSLCVLLCLWPLFLTLAIIIKITSPGPVFFQQTRLGMNGKLIKVYKFRSMKNHIQNKSYLEQATRHDSRITPIGKFIRRTSLDELPQFFNVLKGEMSVVGPRPHALQHNELFKDKVSLYMQRHRVKPGITGWAQIHGLRGETDTQEKMARRVEFDIHYIQHWSLWMDVKIILWTACYGWKDDHAY